MQAILGIGVFIAICWLVSESRRDITWRFVVIGLSIQLALAYLFIQVEWVANALLMLNSIVEQIEAATTAGTTFLFGYLGGGETPFEISKGSAMYLFAFRVLPQVVVFSAIIAVLWYWGVLPAIVRAFGWLLQRTLGVSGALGTSGAATLFLGMVETPLVVRAYLKELSRSEYFCLMTFGMSTVAGSVMVLYASVLNEYLPGGLGHILSASVLNVIGATYVARMLIPSDSSGTGDRGTGLKYASLMDAITRGTTDGLALAMNVGAMLLVLLSLVALVNGLLGLIPIGDLTLSLELVVGWIFAPVAWLIGIPWSEAIHAGSLLGTKLVLNELVAYLQFAGSTENFSAKSQIILIYALCGFANFGSLGILLGGLNTMVPERREETLEIAPKSLISGTLVTLITGAVIGLVV
ncbi:MAG: nucleoside:proton symporter [Pseudomonadales bacterium]|nr:nucleoside:proton symporter [Pseudomonadales bacterium]